MVEAVQGLDGLWMTVGGRPDPKWMRTDYSEYGCEEQLDFGFSVKGKCAWPSILPCGASSDFTSKKGWASLDMHQF